MLLLLVVLVVYGCCCCLPSVGSGGLAAGTVDHGLLGGLVVLGAGAHSGVARSLVPLPFGSALLLLLGLMLLLGLGLAVAVRRRGYVVRALARARVLR